MKCNDVELLLIDYLDNSLDAATRERVESHLHTCEACSKEVKQLQLIEDNIKTVEMQQPSAALRAGFLAALGNEEAEMEKQPVKQLPGKKVISLTVGGLVWRAAAAIIILFTGILIGNKMKFDGTQVAVNKPDEKQIEKRKILANMLDDESPSQRIEAVNYAEGIAANDQKVINVLLNTLNTDKNTNVRVAAVYALEKFSGDKAVLDSLCMSLPKQTEPIVQILLIDILSAKKAIKAKQPIQDIIQNSKTIKPVKDAAVKGLKQL